LKREVEGGGGLAELHGQTIKKEREKKHKAKAQHECRTQRLDPCKGFLKGNQAKDGEEERHKFVACQGGINRKGRRGNSKGG